MRHWPFLPGCLLGLSAAVLGAPPESPRPPSPPSTGLMRVANPPQAAPDGRPPASLPSRPSALPVSPGSETTARDLLTPPPPGATTHAESSARELQGGAGEVYIPPPPIPPAPPSMFSTEVAQGEAGARAPLSLEQLEDLALKNNPTLLQARAQVERFFGTAIQGGLWPNPTVSYLGMNLGNAGTAGSWQGGMFSQPIITAGKRRLDRARFLETTKAAQWEAMAVEYRVLNDIRIHYFRTIGNQAIVEIQKELLQNAEDMVVTIRESYNLGIHNRRELHEVNAALQDARLEYLNAQNMYRQSYQQLMAIVGVQMPFTPLAGGLEGDTTPLEWDASLNRILEFSPEIQKTYANLKFEEVSLKWQRVQPWPNLVAVGGAGYHFPSQRATAQAQLHVVGVPVWNWNQGNIRATNAQVLRQQAEIRRVSLKLQSDLAMIYQGYLTGLQHVESYQRVVLPELRRAYELALDSYEDDRNTWGDVLIAQRSYYMNRMSYVTHLMAWRENEVLIVGFLLHGGLMPAPSPMPPTMMPAGVPNLGGMMTPPGAIAPPP